MVTPKHPPVVSSQTLLVYRASAKQRIESFLGSISDSRLHTMAAAVLAGVFLVAFTLGFTELLQQWNPNGLLGDLFEAIIAGTLATVLVWLLFDIARTRRQRLMAYVQQVADLNHHVRNALQVIRFQAAISKDESEAVARINEAITRIDEALRQMYPLIVDQDPTMVDGVPRPVASYDPLDDRPAASARASESR
jgi:hypothetical protein